MTRPCAYNLTRREIYYRHDAFSAGLRAAGYDVTSEAPRIAKLGDVMLIWNRYGDYDERATRFESQGGRVVVAENGYLGPGGISPHAMNPRQWYALALKDHNGAGSWVPGGAERFEALGVEVKPWRTEGGHVLVCPNRNFGTVPRLMPLGWDRHVAKRLAGITKREVRIRPHPGNSQPKKPLAEDLAGAWACVIWASSAGVHALVAGIPVVAECPYWIAKGATGLIEDIDAPQLPDRMPTLHALAWAQWDIAEIETGEPFRRLLSE